MSFLDKPEREIISAIKQNTNGDEDFVCSFSGLIGVGKTTLATRVLDYLQENDTRDVVLLPEPQLREDPWLGSTLNDFYNDMETFGFHFQLYLLRERAQQLMDTRNRFYKDIDGRKKRRAFITDRFIGDDLAFSWLLYKDGKMTKKAHKAHCAKMMTAVNKLPSPGVVFFLKCSPEKALQRIQRRARSEEVGVITLEYLQKLSEAYETIFPKYFADKFQIINIDN